MNEQAFLLQELETLRKLASQVLAALHEALDIRAYVSVHRQAPNWQPKSMPVCQHQTNPIELF